VVGYARIREVLRLPISKIWREHSAAACISKKEFDEYFYGLKFGFAIFLEKIRLLTPEVAAADLQEKLGIVPPQSYRYVVKNCISLLRDDRLQAFDRHQRRNRA
jgi:predicted transcriptional regulator